MSQVWKKASKNVHARSKWSKQTKTAHEDIYMLHEHLHVHIQINEQS